MRISVWDSAELQGWVLAMRGLERETQKQIRTALRQITAPEWQKAIAERASTRFQHRVLVSSARVQVSNQNVTLRSGHVGRSLQGGIKPSEAFGAAEFGADRNKLQTYTATRGGKSFKVTRHTQRQLPAVNRKGHAVYPAAASIIPRIASLMVQTLVRTFHEQTEKR